MVNTIETAVAEQDISKLARFIELELIHEGYTVDVIIDGRKAIEKFQHKAYDLVLLDLMQPHFNGIEILSRIRRSSQVPVIMLTAKSDIDDKVSGLDRGADDYITKPFSIEELLARIRVLFRRKNVLDAYKDNLLKIKDLTIDLQKHKVKRNDSEIELTKTEYKLLLFLIKNKNIVLTREQIMNQVWGYDYFGETNIVDVYIRYLRVKIEDYINDKIIYTTRGVGYCIKDE